LNVESLFNLVEMGRLIGRLPGTETPEQIEDAVRAVRRLLAQTIERTCTFGFTDGQVHPRGPYGSLANHVRHVISTTATTPDWAFVTFNYDLALDQALYWNTLELDYGLQPPTNNPRRVGLYKLHGSLNWSLCGCGEILPLAWNLVGVVLPSEVGGLARLQTTDRLATTSPARLQTTGGLAGAWHGCGQASTGEPAIVPPSWNKTQYQKGFARVWSRAAAELAAAENIVVIGYSLPDSDAFFHDLFRLGLPGPTRVRRFVVINPNGEACERFRELLGPELRVRFEPYNTGFEDLLTPSDGGPTMTAVDWIIRQRW